jgi:hypothetical protein
MNSRQHFHLNQAVRWAPLSEEKVFCPQRGIFIKFNFFGGIKNFVGNINLSIECWKVGEFSRGA